MFTCRLCGQSGGNESFYGASKVRCKKCVNAISKQRYHEFYRNDLLAIRAAKNHQLKNRPVTLPDVERAYAAGLIDGEGSIRITHRGKNGGTSLRPGQYTLMVEMTNTDQAMLEWLRVRFGGSISHAPASPERNAREKWHWRVAANLALYCLDAIWPYVMTKRTQAKLGRRFQRYAQYAGRARTERVQQLHERFYNEFRVLNARGLRAQLAKQTLSQ